MTSNIPFTHRGGKLVNPNGFVPRDNAFNSIWSGSYAASIATGNNIGPTGPAGPEGPAGSSAGSTNGLNVYYTSVSRTGSALEFGSNSRLGLADGGAYTVSSLVNDTNYVTLNSTPSAGYFVTAATGTYLVDFSISSSYGFQETKLDLAFVTKSSGSPFSGGTSIPLCSLGKPNDGPFAISYGSLAGRAIVSLNSGDTFGVTIVGQSSGFETYVSGGVLTVRPLFTV